MVQSVDHRSSWQGERLVRLKDILAPTGPIPVSRAAWYRGIQEGRFPKPIQLGSRAVAWRASDVSALFGKDPR